MSSSEIGRLEETHVDPTSDVDAPRKKSDGPLPPSDQIGDNDQSEILDSNDPRKDRDSESEKSGGTEEVMEGPQISEQEESEEGSIVGQEEGGGGGGSAAEEDGGGEERGGDGELLPSPLEIEVAWDKCVDPPTGINPTEAFDQLVVPLEELIARARKINELRDQLSQRHNGPSNEDVDLKNVRGEVARARSELKEVREQKNKLDQEIEEAIKLRDGLKCKIASELFETAMVQQNICKVAQEGVKLIYTAPTHKVEESECLDNWGNRSDQRNCLNEWIARALLVTIIAANRYEQLLLRKQDYQIYLDMWDAEHRARLDELELSRQKFIEEKLAFSEYVKDIGSKKRRAYSTIYAGNGAQLRGAKDLAAKAAKLESYIKQTREILGTEADQLSKQIAEHQANVASQNAEIAEKEARVQKRAEESEMLNARALEMMSSSQSTLEQSREAHAAAQAKQDEAAAIEQTTNAAVVYLARADVKLSDFLTQLKGFTTELQNIGLAPESDSKAATAAPGGSRGSKPAGGSQTNAKESEATESPEALASAAYPTFIKIVNACDTMFKVFERCKSIMKSSAESYLELQKGLGLTDPPNVKTLADKMRQLTNAADSLKKEIESSTAERDKLTAQESELSSVLKNLQIEEGALKNKLQTLAADLGARNDELAQLKASTDMQNEALEKTKLEKESLEEQLGTMEESRRVLELKCQDTNLNINQAKRTLACLEDKTAKSTKRNEDLIKRIDELEKNLVQLEDPDYEQAQQKRVLELEVRQLLERKQKLQNDCQSLNGKLQR